MYYTKLHNSYSSFRFTKRTLTPIILQTRDQRNHNRSLDVA